MKLYTKKPVSILAVEWTGDNLEEVKRFLGDNFGGYRAERHPGGKSEIIIVTLEDGIEYQVEHAATIGDFIIQGIEGEFYPCKPDIFRATYDVKDTYRIPDQRVFGDIQNELDRCRQLHPNNADIITALAEEVGELSQALIQQKHEKHKGVTDKDVYKEAIQSAVVAIRIAAEGDSNFPYSPRNI